MPASLGNQDHVLPPGWVCDACNNYLSREVEAPFLNSEYGRRARFEMGLRTKRGRIPVIEGVYLEGGCPVSLMYDGEDALMVFATRDEDQRQFGEALSSATRGSLVLPTSGDPPAGPLTSRFIAKIAVEVFALWGIGLSGWNEELVDKTELDEIRNYVRRGTYGFTWPVHMRRLYAADHQFSDAQDPEFQVLHEWNILFLPEVPGSNTGEYYAVIAVLGMEFAINLGGPELDGYLKWLAENGSRSFLY